MEIPAKYILYKCYVSNEINSKILSEFLTNLQCQMLKCARLVEKELGLNLTSLKRHMSKLSESDMNMLRETYQQVRYWHHVWKSDRTMVARNNWTDSKKLFRKLQRDNVNKLKSIINNINNLNIY